METLVLIIPAFIAGFLTFLTPCTLPLVPGYIAFISGSSAKELQSKDRLEVLKKKILINGLLYILGFTVVFVFLGTFFAIAGAALVDFRIWLTRIGGLFVIFFGLYMMHVFQLPAFNVLNQDKRFHIANKITPGNPLSSFLFGASFAFGWTPCVGPILGTILILASTSTTITSGALLLLVFSLGLALPFLLTALAFGQATRYIKHITKYLHIISFIGGLFLLVIGILLLTERLGLWVDFFFRFFGAYGYENILDYL